MDKTATSHRTKLLAVIDLPQLCSLRAAHSQSASRPVDAQNGSAVGGIVGAGGRVAQRGLQSCTCALPGAIGGSASLKLRGSASQGSPGLLQFARRDHIGVPAGLPIIACGSWETCPRALSLLSRTPFDRPPYIVWDFDQNLPMGHIGGSPPFWEFLADVDAIIDGHLRLFVCPNLCQVVSRIRTLHIDYGMLWDIVKVNYSYLHFAYESALLADK
jgi:hypothetical protein